MAWAHRVVPDSAPYYLVPSEPVDSPRFTVDAGFHFQPGLANLKIKADRAKTHLDALKQETAQHRTKYSYTVRKEDDPQNGFQVVYFEMNPLGPGIPTLIGEFAYNLRSGLD